MNLEKLAPWFNLHSKPLPAIKLLPFAEYRKLPKNMGLYAIFQSDRCIYVGKGDIPSRFKHHHNKAYEIWETTNGKRNGTQDPLGWKDLRAQEWFDPKSWTIEFFEEAGHVNRTAYEGIMMLVLQPFANDESYADRQHSSKI